MQGAGFVTCKVLKWTALLCTNSLYQHTAFNGLNSMTTSAVCNAVMCNAKERVHVVKFTKQTLP